MDGMSIENEMEKFKGDTFEQTVIEAYRRVLLGNTFEVSNTSNIWFFYQNQKKKKR